MEKTLIIQSYRTHDVAPWIARCMASVQDWAAGKGYDYRFFDDSFFELTPQWYRNKVNNEIHLVTDFARLEAILRALRQGYDRAVWIDADVLVFNPAALTIPDDQTFGFGMEQWLKQNDQGLKVKFRVHNAVMHFRRTNPFLRYYMYAAKSVVRTAHRRKLVHTAVGPSLLSALHQAAPLPLWEVCALFSPLTLLALADQDETLIKATAEHYPSPIACANLCATFNAENHTGTPPIADTVFEVAIDKLLHTKGEIFNRFVQKRS